MNSENRATTLSAFALGLIALCFLILLQEVVISQKLWAEIPRIFAGLVLPVPIAIFLAFVFASRNSSAAKEPSPVKMTVLLALSIVGTIGLGGLALSSSLSSDSASGTGPLITESSVFTASVLNFFFLRSQIMAAVLSGVSIGLTIFVIFLT